MSQTIEWAHSPGAVAYEMAVRVMEVRVEAIAAGRGPELVWLLEHPPLYTAGTSARKGDLLAPGRFPVHRSGRGGQLTYHGPGQRVAYAMLDLRRRGQDVRCFVHDLERWLVATLAAFGIEGACHPDRIGVWVETGGEEKKIAALGIRLRKWISFHGIALNVDPDLEHFSGIVPCGLPDHGVTSLRDLGLTVSMADVDIALRHSFEAVFGRTVAGNAPQLDGRSKEFTRTRE